MRTLLLFVVISFISEVSLAQSKNTKSISQLDTLIDFLGITIFGAFTLPLGIRLVNIIK